jgi:hypothetical protein
MHGLAVRQRDGLIVMSAAQMLLPDTRAADRSQGSLRPIWAGDLPGTLGVEEIRLGWMGCLHRDPSSSVYLHPDIALLAGTSSDEPPIVYGSLHPGETGPESVSSIGVFGGKGMDVRPVPGLPLKLSLRGRYLVANRLLGEADPREVVGLLRFVRELLLGPQVDFVLFDDLDTKSPLWRELAAIRDRGISVFYPAQPQPHWWIDVPGRPDDYWNHFTPRRRKELRRQARNFEHAVTRFTTEADVEPFLERAHEVALKHWQAKRRGLRIHNSPQEVRALKAIAALGGLRSYVLDHGGKPVAFYLAIQWGGCFVPEEVGYDLAFAKASPGTTLLLRVMEDVLTRDTPRLVDFGAGDAEYKRLFCTTRTESGPVVIAPRRWRPMSALWMQQVSRGLSGQLRAGLTRMGALKKLRQLYRR